MIKYNYEVIKVEKHHIEQIFDAMIEDINALKRATYFTHIK